jgi:hypothetical protein
LQDNCASLLRLSDQWLQKSCGPFNNSRGHLDGSTTEAQIFEASNQPFLCPYIGGVLAPGQLSESQREETAQ